VVEVSSMVKSLASSPWRERSVGDAEKKALGWKLLPTSASMESAVDGRMSPDNDERPAGRTDIWTKGKADKVRPAVGEGEEGLIAPSSIDVLFLGVGGASC